MRRIAKWGVDRRFEDIRSSPLAFAAFWLLQAVWVYVVALPVILLGLSTKVVPWSAVDAIAAAMFVGGLAIEAVADWQKSEQRERKSWADEGLWRYSRHPNYFGDLLVLWGVYLGAVKALVGGLQWVAVLSPITECVALLFLSGVPILEKGGDDRNGSNEEYWRYKKRTSVIVPLPPAFYEKLPLSVKRWVLLDLPMFNPGQQVDVNGNSQG